ncbi:MAG: hypothetical protein KGJ58_03010 [Patescibacteria group bacterium]|nr:hypothetical protein [Patescibacteria group bacterium]MDE2218395.1 hypothetical protein [Patescibacteria group bacterium]
MDISRELAIQILKYLDKHKDFYFPFLVMSKEYAKEDDDFVEIEPNEWEMIESDESYQTFQLWENLQNLDKRTLKLMTKGFLEEITNESIENHVSRLAKNYRKEWNKKLCESAKIEEYGLNEFIAGKADAFEDCLFLIRKHKNG